jgi:hypothetical protein
MDVRTDDMFGEIEVRTEDFQATKSIELFPASFRVNDATGAVDWASPEAREQVLKQVADAVLQMAGHELMRPMIPAASE